MDSRKALAATLALTVVPGVLAAEIDAENFSAVVTLTSEYVFRGISQSLEDPAIQGGFDFEHPVGLFAGVWASSVQFPVRHPGDTPRDVELDYYLGYQVETAVDWGMGVMLIRYTYPGAGEAVDYDYAELDLSLRFRDVLGASISYSDDVYGFGGRGIAYELTGRQRLPDELEAVAGVGLHELGVPFGGSYLYWNLGLVRRLGRFTLSASYIDTDGRGGEIWGPELAGSRLAVSVSAAIQ